MRENLSFEDIKTLFRNRTDEYHTYFSLCCSEDDPDYRITAIRSGIHADVHGSNGSFYICPDDYICRQDIKNGEFTVKSEESFNRSYKISFPARD